MKLLLAIFTVFSINIYAQLSEQDYSCENSQELFDNFRTNGNGNDTPFFICNGEQFNNIQFFPNANYELAADIDLSSFDVDSYSLKSTSFSGTLEGNGFTISNLNLERAGFSDLGLFKILNNAQIKNVNLQNFKIVGGFRVGAIAARAYGSSSINSVTLTDISIQSGAYTGGLIGIWQNPFSEVDPKFSINEVTGNLEIINNAEFIGGLVGAFLNQEGIHSISKVNLGESTSISGSSQFGGFIGSSIAENLTISDSSFMGKVLGVRGQGREQGGLIGVADHSVIKNISMNAVEVSSDLDPVDPTTGTILKADLGGFVGRVKKETLIENSSFTGTIKSRSSHVGGLVGSGNKVVINSSSVFPNLAVTSEGAIILSVGGVVGNVLIEGSLSSVKVEGTVDGQGSYIGGLVGFFQGGNSSIDTSSFIGTLQGRTSFIGGLTGAFKGKSINSSKFEGMINILSPTPRTYVGGIVGSVLDSSSFSLTNSSADSKIEVLSGSADYIGGLIGDLSSGKIEKSFANTNINQARQFLGGLAGISKGDIVESYAIVEIQGQQDGIGGLVGILVDGKIENSFSIGKISGQNEVGGLVGSLFEIQDTRIFQSYSTVSIEMISGGLESSFGPIYGAPNLDNLSINSFYNSSYLPPGGNNFGIPLNEKQLSDPLAFSGFSFGPDNEWRIATNYLLLGSTSEEYYLSPYPNWAGTEEDVYNPGNGDVEELKKKYQNKIAKLEGKIQNLTERIEQKDEAIAKVSEKISNLETVIIPNRKSKVEERQKSLDDAIATGKNPVKILILKKKLVKAKLQLSNAEARLIRCNERLVRRMNKKEELIGKKTNLESRKQELQNLLDLIS